MRIDDTDRRVLESLVADARTSLRDLAERTGLSAPSIRERIRRMEDGGLLVGFTVDLDAAALGYALEAIVRVEPLPGRLRQVEEALRMIPQVTACDVVTGDDCFVARLALRAIDELDPLLDPLHRIARTSTSIVKRTPVRRRPPPL